MEWSELKEAVENSGNVYTTTMETLRDTHGVGRLGVHVIAEISRELAGQGLGHVPQDLPNSQRDQVRLYKRGTAVGDLIDIVLTPSQSNDEKLAGQFSGETNDYVSIIQKIRELVTP